MPYPRARYRLLTTPPYDGAMNMAIDEAIMLSVKQGEALPTLRFFAWSPPCLSIGHAQKIEEVDQTQLKALGYTLVRRPTGGKAILHTDELTYSIVTTQDDPRVAGDIIESYRRLSAGLVKGLELLDLLARNDKTYTSAANEKENPVCFEVPSNYEITLIGKKLIGSAQARRQGMVLQHGTLPLTGDLTRICDVLTFANEAARAEAKTRLQSRALTLAEALGQEVTYDTAVYALQKGFAETLDLELVEGELSENEKNMAAELVERKYKL